jgi:rfaE bifunctional protein kinase chain/domain
MNADQVFEQFGNKRILVVGDVMIDEYLRGKVDRISPEAPVPIINLNKKEERLGGAANVALNLLSLGAEPVLCAVVGKDRAGDQFNALLDKRGLTKAGIINSSERRTTVKTRVIGDNQHLLRIDDEEVAPLTSQEEKNLIEKISEFIQNGIDAIILEDYNKGLLTKYVITEVIRIANDNNVITTVDPKKENFFEYKNVTLFKPNLKELKEGLNIEFDFAEDRTAFENAINVMESRLQNKLSLVTLSEHGVFIQDEGEKIYHPAHLRKIADVSGAGDTVISVATLCLSAGLSPSQVAAIANLAGGLVCEFSGVVPIDKDLLKREVEKL